jgi:hypothetical protein
MRHRALSRRLFFGEWHRICPYCGIWFKAGKRSHTQNCLVCKESIKYCQENNLPPPKKEHNIYIDYDVEDIEAELRGEMPIKGLFESCSLEKIEALETGDVKKFLSIKG